MILIKYFQTIKASILTVEHYIESLEKPLKTSFLFFISTMIILGLINGANIAIKVLPEIKTNLDLALIDLNEHFDKNLEILWADDQLELNQNYVNIYWPSTIDYKTYGLPKLLGIISNSQKPPFESEFITNNSALIYINNNYLYTLQNNSQHDWVEYPLSTIFDGLSSYSLNKQNLPKITSSISDSINKLFPEIQMIVVITSSIFYLFSKSWFLLMESILVFLLFKIYGLGFNFKKVLKLCLNIMVPTAIIETASTLIYSDLTLPMGTIAFWTMLTFISFNLKKEMVNKETD